MMQQINLYQPVFRKQKKVFSALTMLQLGVFFIFVFAALYAYELYRLAPLKEQMTILDDQVQVMNEQLEKLKKQQPTAAKKALLEKEIARVSKELAERRRIQQTLVNQETGGSTGFSAYLEALARQHVEGTWLTRIAITDGGRALGLEGMTLASEYVPVYIQHLANEQSLAGASFNVVELTRPKDIENAAQIAFRVSTK